MRRRSFFISSLSSLLIASKVRADSTDTDLTSQLFNSDGSLKEGSSISTKTTFRSVSLDFPDSSSVEATTSASATDAPIIYTNGQATSSYGEAGEATAQSIRRVNYQLPSKWTSDSTYTDTTAGLNLPACNRILVYQTAKKTSPKILEKATMTGVAKALQAQSTSDFSLANADLVTAKKSEKNGFTYWDFDLAVAPLKCEGERKKEDLGLGFCPYEYVVLLSATVINDRMYVFQLDCDREQWKRSNSDLKLVRQGFTVEV